MRLQQQFQQAIAVASDHRDRAVVMPQEIAAPDDRLLDAIKRATSRLGLKQIDRLIAGLPHARGEIRVRRLSCHHHPSLHARLTRGPRDISRKRQGFQEPLLLVLRSVLACHPHPQNKKTAASRGRAGETSQCSLFVPVKSEFVKGATA